MDGERLAANNLAIVTLESTFARMIARRARILLLRLLAEFPAVALSRDLAAG